jgi:hypothetical protein
MLTLLHTGSAAELIRNSFDTAGVSLIIVNRLCGERRGYYIRLPAIVDIFDLHQSVQFCSETHKASSVTSIRETSSDAKDMFSLFLKIQMNVMN